MAVSVTIAGPVRPSLLALGFSMLGYVRSPTLGATTDNACR
jgi:hypothetical protein